MSPITESHGLQYQFVCCVHIKSSSLAKEPYKRFFCQKSPIQEPYKKRPKIICTSRLARWQKSPIKEPYSCGALRQKKHTQDFHVCSTTPQRSPVTASRATQKLCGVFAKKMGFWPQFFFRGIHVSRMKKSCRRTWMSHVCVCVVCVCCVCVCCVCVR